MQIKRLRLAGFKSFVEPADLRIEPGLTGVVGPNGCGKSNVLEALRWVMGESSARSMRGAGMEDVIFAGTTKRPARDFAEVTISLDRDAAEVAGETERFPEGEVEVTRRIERGAGSAYRLNGRDVRARDVALLFADAATGAHSPALVSQGRIGAIIAAKPAERRAMLEEAAGIAGLHVRRRDAENRLRATEANLERLDQLLADMEQRGAALKRQARTAERYRRLSDDIRVAEARLVFARWREAAGAAEIARGEAGGAVSAVEAANGAHEDAGAAQRSAIEEVTRARAAASAAREEAAEIGHRLARLLAERDVARRRLAELTQRRDQQVADRQRQAAIGADATAVLARLAGELAVIDDRLDTAADRHGMLEARLGNAAAAAQQGDAALTGARAALAGQEADLRLARGQADAATAQLLRARSEAARLAEQLKAIGDGSDLDARGHAARARRIEAEAAQAAAGAALSAAERRREQAVAQRDAAQADSAAARAALAALEAEAKALRAAAAGPARGDRMLDQVRAARGFERALAAALGDDLDAALSPDAPRRWAGAEAQADDPPLGAGTVPLAARVAAPAELARRLAQVMVADSDDGRLLAVGQRLVTRDGRLRRWDGFVATDVGAAAAERLIRANRLEELQALLPPAGAALMEGQQRVTAASACLEEARMASEGARRAETAATTAIREAARAEDQVSAERERLASRRHGLEERAEQAARDLDEATRRASGADAAVAALPDAAVARHAVQVAADAAEVLQRRLAEARAELATHDRAVAADTQRRAAAGQEHEAWTARIARAADHDDELASRIAAADEELDALADAPDALDRQVRGAEAATREAATGAASAGDAEHAAEAGQRAADAALAVAAEALAGAREQRAGALARAESQDSRRVEMGRISGEKFGCPPPLLPQHIGFDEAQVAAAQAESVRLERLAHDRERIGPVNLVAERELADIEGERATGQAEREEIGTACHRLRGSIGSLNREGRARLLAAFTRVDEHFRSLFTTLFEGGQAHLELIESDDPLEAGLEIMAQPPGKRLQSLTLLSGGEQALTAIALIFALFLTNPAPVCVLDEVDAPLDDANVERFCTLLDRMTADTDTRYLIVTHNAVTMSRMHRLFGVTMVEQGVSRLVSVDLGSAERLLAAE